MIGASKEELVEHRSQLEELRLTMYTDAHPKWIVA